VARYIVLADSTSNGWSDERLAAGAVASKLPFQTNLYVVEDLIDWRTAMDDRIWLLVSSSPVMLPVADVPGLADLPRESDSRAVPQNKHSRVETVPTAEDQHAASLLTLRCSSATGHALRADVLPQLLTAEEPTIFLADEQTNTRCVEAIGLASCRNAR
jgi:hypothetical protein